jgi:hypothetical protein
MAVRPAKKADLLQIKRVAARRGATAAQFHQLADMSQSILKERLR